MTRFEELIRLEHRVVETARIVLQVAPLGGEPLERGLDMLAAALRARDKAAQRLVEAEGEQRKKTREM